MAPKSAVPLTAKNLAYAQLAAGSDSRLQRAPSKLSMASGRLPEAAHCACPSMPSESCPAPLTLYCQCMHSKGTAWLQTLLLASHCISQLSGHRCWLTWTQPTTLAPAGVESSAGSAVSAASGLSNVVGGRKRTQQLTETYNRARARLQALQVKPPERPTLAKIVMDATLRAGLPEHLTLADWSCMPV